MKQTLNLTITPTEARALSPNMAACMGVRAYFLSLEVTAAAACNERRVLKFGDRDEDTATVLRQAYLAAIRAGALPKTRRRLLAQLSRLDRYLETPLIDQIGGLEDT